MSWLIKRASLKRLRAGGSQEESPPPPQTHTPVRSHLLREPRLDDAQQSQSGQRAEAVDIDQLPDQTHAEDALQRRDPNEVRQAQTLWEDRPHAVIGKVTYFDYITI